MSLTTADVHNKKLFGWGGNNWETSILQQLPMHPHGRIHKQHGCVCVCVCVCVKCSLFSRTTIYRINNLPPMITEHQLHTNRWVCTHGMGKTTVWQRYRAERVGNYIKVEILTSADINFIQTNQWITAWVEAGISWDMHNYIQFRTQFQHILKAPFWYCSNKMLSVICTTLFTDSWNYYITFSPRHTVHITFLCSYRHNMKNKLDVCGSVHHSIIHIENPTRCHSVSKFYFIFIWSSTCFGRHTAHHQEPKTALVASGFAYVEGCWTCSCCMLSVSSNYTSNNLPHMQNQRLLVQF